MLSPQKNLMKYLIKSYKELWLLFPVLWILVIIVTYLYNPDEGVISALISGAIFTVIMIIFLFPAFIWLNRIIQEHYQKCRINKKEGEYLLSVEILNVIIILGIILITGGIYVIFTPIIFNTVVNTTYIITVLKLLIPGIILIVTARLLLMYLAPKQAHK